MAAKMFEMVPPEELDIELLAGQALGLTAEELAALGEEAEEGGEPGRELELVPHVSRPLYEVEEELAILFETAGLEGVEGREEEYLAELGAAMAAAVAKRDQVAQFMAHLEGQISLADREIARLSARREVYAKGLARMEGYVLRILETFERDERGRPPRLEGSTSTFTLRACPASVNVISEEDVPAVFKMVEPKLPAELWEEVLDSLEFELMARVEAALGGAPKTRVMLDAVKKAIKLGIKVEGAELRIDKNNLVRK